MYKFGTQNAEAERHRTSLWVWAIRNPALTTLSIGAEFPTYQTVLYTRVMILIHDKLV